MSNELLQGRIDALKKRNGSNPELLVRELLRDGHTTIVTDENGAPLGLRDLSDTLRIVVVTACEEFLNYNGHGVRFAPFMERHDNAASVARSKLSRLTGTGAVGCPMLHHLSDESIEEGLLVFSEMIIAQARKHLPRCFVGADVTRVMDQVSSHSARNQSSHPKRSGRKGDRVPRSQATFARH